MADATSTIERGKSGRSTVTVTVPADVAAQSARQALEKLGSQVNVKGFRPGKAPESVVREKIDPERLFEETVRLALRVTLPGVLREHSLAPIIPPRVETVSREPLTLAISFVERPPVTVKNPGKLAPAKKETAVDPKDVERVVQSALAEHRSYANVDRPAKTGDRVTVGFSAVGPDGAAIAGLSAQGERIVLGESRLLPGFEDALVGVGPGQTKTFVLTLPEKFQLEALRGKQATFTATVQTVDEVSTPVFDDAFAKAHLHQPTAQAFRDMVASTIKEQEAQFERMARERTLLDAIRDATQAELPDELVDQELRQLVEEWAVRLEQQGRSVEDALKAQGKTAKQVEEELRAEAVNRWKLRLGIAKLIEDRKIEITHDEERAAVDAFLANLPDEDRDEAAKRIAGKDSLYDEVRWRATVDKLIAELLA